MRKATKKAPTPKAPSSNKTNRKKNGSKNQKTKNKNLGRCGRTLSCTTSKTSSRGLSSMDKLVCFIKHESRVALPDDHPKGFFFHPQQPSQVRFPFLLTTQDHLVQPT